MLGYSSGVYLSPGPKEGMVKSHFSLILLQRLHASRGREQTTLWQVLTWRFEIAGSLHSLVLQNLLRAAPHNTCVLILIQSPRWEDRLAFDSPGELSERWHQGISGLWCLSNFCSWTAPYVKTLVRNSRPVSHSTCQGSSDHVILGFQPHAASLRGKNPQITAVALIDKYPLFQSLIAKYILSSNPYSSLEVSR